MENNFTLLIFLYYLQTRYEENNSKRIEKVKYYEILCTVTKGIVLMCGRNATSLFDVATYSHIRVGRCDVDRTIMRWVSLAITERGETLYVELVMA